MGGREDLAVKGDPTAQGPGSEGRHASPEAPECETLPHTGTQQAFPG